MRQLTHVKFLHSVRGIAALIVVIYHAKFVLWCGGHEYLRKTGGLHTLIDYLLFAGDILSSCGRQSVIIFFILSAFVIKYSFVQNQYSWTVFYKHRFIRIYFPYLLSVVFSIIIIVLAVLYPVFHANITNALLMHIMTCLLFQS
jgi:peptidoglycan/LPS O-acetylase OafA/YrhL